MSIDTEMISAEPLNKVVKVQRRVVEAAHAGLSYSCHDVRERDDIAALAPEWRALEAKSQGSTVFQSFDFCLPWLDAYVFGKAPTHRAHVLAFYDQKGALIALAPFAQEISGLATMAEWIGEPLIQYGDILMDPQADRVALRHALSKALGAWQVAGMLLRNVRADARIVEVLEMDHAQLGEPREAALVELAQFEDAEAYFDTFSKRSKKNRRKKRRDLEALGTLTHRTVAPGDEAASLCKLCLDWKIAWLAERGLSSRAFMNSRALGTLVDMLSRDTDTNPYRLFVLELDGAPVAIEIGLVGPMGNTAFIGTYNPALEANSPGKVQMEATIMHGFDAGWPAYDMLAPMSEYKQSWCTKTVGVADYMIPSTLVGSLYRDVYLRTLRPAAKTIWARLPTSVRNVALRKSGGLASL